MLQGAVSSTMQTLPMVHVARMVEGGAWFVVVGIAVGLAVMLWIRRRGWSWTCGLPMLVVAPYASVFGCEPWWVTAHARSRRSAPVRLDISSTCEPVAISHRELGIASDR